MKICKFFFPYIKSVFSVSVLTSRNEQNMENAFYKVALLAPLLVIFSILDCSVAALQKYFYPSRRTPTEIFNPHLHSLLLTLTLWAFHVYIIFYSRFLPALSITRGLLEPVQAVTGHRLGDNLLVSSSSRGHIQRPRTIHTLSHRN